MQEETIVNQSKQNQKQNQTQNENDKQNNKNCRRQNAGRTVCGTPDDFIAIGNLLYGNNTKLSP